MLPRDPKPGDSWKQSTTTTIDTDGYRDTYCPGRGLVESHFERRRNDAEVSRSRHVVDP